MCLLALYLLFVKHCCKFMWWGWCSHYCTARDVVPSKILSYNRANRAVAILCNHQVQYIATLLCTLWTSDSLAFNVQVSHHSFLPSSVLPRRRLTSKWATFRKRSLLKRMPSLRQNLRLNLSKKKSRPPKTQRPPSKKVINTCPETFLLWQPLGHTDNCCIKRQPARTQAYYN